jgi:hypothetical protein
MSPFGHPQLTAPRAATKLFTALLAELAYASAPSRMNNFG